jgi:mannosyltransferase OCH1-like enzyme
MMHKRVAAPRDHDSSTGAELLDDEKVHSRLWYHIGIRYILLALTVTVTVLILVAGFPAASALDELESLSAEGSKANLMKQRIAAILQQQRQQRQQRREQQQQWTLEDTKASELVTARHDLSAFQQRLQGRGGGNALSWWGTSEPEPRPTFAELSKSLPSFEELSTDWKPPAAAAAFPRVLHQTWRTHMVPPRLAVFMRSWRERSASGWSFRLHTDEDNAALVQSRYSWLHKSYLMMNAIQRADVARLLYMHAFGGVYADLDVELLAPLDALLNQTATLGASAMLGQEPLPHAVLLERQPRQICNAVLASARGHPFWLWALHMAALRVSTDQGWGDPVGSTGPRMLEQAVIKWQARHANTELSLQIAQPDTFFPLWDSMQKETFEARCLFNDYANQSEIVAASLSDLVVSTCDRLRAEGFTPTIPPDGSALAAHHWAHSWMDSFSDRFQEDKVRDVLMLDQTNDQMAGDQTRIRGLGHEQ